jgi:hypothetical protein
METRLDATSSGSSAAPRWRRLALALAVLLAAAVAVVVAVVFGTRSSPQPTTNNGVSSALSMAICFSPSVAMISPHWWPFVFPTGGH